jgi:hypothetical protein
MSASIIADTVKQKVEEIRHEVVSRSYQAANELRNASLYVLRGQGGGRRYRVSGSRATYQASAPGSPPAVRSGAFRMSWAPRVTDKGDEVIASIESNLMVGRWVLGGLLEDGTRKMAPRPHHEAIKDRALPNIIAIFSKPY